MREGETRRASRLALHELRVHSEGIAKYPTSHHAQLSQASLALKFTGKFMLDCERRKLGGGVVAALKGSALEARMHMHMHDYITLYCIHKESVLLLEQVMIFCT